MVYKLNIVGDYAVKARINLFGWRVTLFTKRGRFDERINLIDSQATAVDLPGPFTLMLAANVTKDDQAEFSAEVVYESTGTPVWSVRNVQAPFTFRTSWRGGEINGLVKIVRE